jgi:hypothetical protein
MRRSLITAGLVLASLTAMACGPTSSSSKSSGGSDSTLACGHWDNIRGDVRAGILTDSEIRTKVSEVRSSATSPAVKSAATDLLAAVTSRSKSGITTSYAALTIACGG